MRSLIASTEDFIKLAESKLAADVAAGSNVSLTLYGNGGMAQNNYIVIGTEGTDTCEIQLINAAVTMGTSVQVATLTYAHKQDEPVRIFRYNQRKFYGSLTATGAYSELVSSGSPKTIQVNDPQGTYFEYTGIEGYAYFKATYYNSTTTDETDINDAAATLADESVRYCSLYAIRNQAGFVDNPFITDGILEEYRKRAENEVNSYLYQRYVLPLLNQTTNLPEIPFLVENATRLLAAGYMDYREYGKTGEGVKWLGEARGILNSIQKGTQRLIGTDMQEFQQKNLTQGVMSYPDSVDNTDDDGPVQLFSMKQLF